MRTLLLVLMTWLSFALNLQAQNCLLLDLSRPVSHRFSLEDRQKVSRMLHAQFDRDYAPLKMVDERALGDEGFSAGDNCYSCDGERQLELARSIGVSQLITYRLYYEMGEYRTRLLLLDVRSGELLNRRDSANSDLNRLVVNIPYEMEHLCRSFIGSAQPVSQLDPVTIHISSKPEGAEFWKDGVLLGSTPLDILLQPAVSQIELRQQGRAEFKQSLVLGIDTLLVFDLATTMGKISVHSNPQGQPLYIDGRLLGRTPVWDAEVAAGEHSLRVGNPETHEPVTQRIEIQAGEHKEYKLLLTPMEGLLTVAATTVLGEVLPVSGYLDGNSLGVLPWQGMVPVGVHRIRVGAQERVISIYDYQSQVVEFTLDGFDSRGEAVNASQAWLILRSTPENQPVILDGVLQGRTPLFARVPSKKELRVRVGDGTNAVAQERLVSLGSGEHRRVEFELVPLRGFLALDCVDLRSEPVRLPLFVDGVREAQLPFADSLLAGEHTLRVGSWVRTLRLAIGESRQLTWELDTLVIPDGRRVSVIQGPLAGMNFVEIPAGSFVMGCDDAIANSDEQPLRTVSVEAFQLMTTEVTQAMWQEVMRHSPVSFTCDTRPAENISREQMVAFIKRLNKRDKAWKYRLPSEAEWEYAARAGREDAYFFSDSVDHLSEYAWFAANSSEESAPVASLRPNSWGLYDMLGNVWEVCADKYQDRYPNKDGDASPRRASTNRYVRRGGSWANEAGNCRVYNRGYLVNSQPSDRVGFRLAREAR